MPVIPALKPWGFEFSLGAVNPGHHCNKNKYIVDYLHIITTSQSVRVTHTFPPLMPRCRNKECISMHDQVL